MALTLNPVTGKLDVVSKVMPGDAVVLVDTRANILATSPSAGSIGLATNDKQAYIYDGTSWQRTQVRLQEVKTGTSIGVYDDDWGDGFLPGVLTHQKLIGPVIESTSREAATGMLRMTVAIDPSRVLQVYQGGEWKSLRALNQAQIDDIALWSLLDHRNVDQYGVPIIHGGTKDIGAFSIPMERNGGTF